MGLSTVFSSIASGAVSDAIKWIADMAPVVTLISGVALLGIVLVSLRKLF